MNILVTNDDGYNSKGIKVLVEIMRQFGDVTVIAPKKHQSGMAMAVSLGLKQIAYRELANGDAGKMTWKLKEPVCQGEKKHSVRWTYLDGTPATCVKFALNQAFGEYRPDVVVSGINHGSNAAMAACYSGTLGATAEAALNGIPAIGVSLNDINPDADFSAVVRYFPEIFRRLMSDLPESRGIYYNVNFPKQPADRIKGLSLGRQGKGVYIKEFLPWDPKLFAKYGITPEMLGQSSVPNMEEGEELYVMTGEFREDPQNNEESDNRLNEAGYIAVVPHNIYNTDMTEYERLDRKRNDTESLFGAFEAACRQ